MVNSFGKFVKYNSRETFDKSCNPAESILVQQRDISQNCKIAKIELQKAEAAQFCILPSFLAGQI